MFSNLSNTEILNNLLEGIDLDDLTSRSLMQRWLNDVNCQYQDQIYIW